MQNLSTSTIDQLDIGGRSHATRARAGCRRGEHTLLNVLNMCSTNAGMRLLARRILAPAVSAEEIDRRYSQVDEFGLLFCNDLQAIDEALRKIVDIERLQRRMCMGIIAPLELANLAMSYEAVMHLEDMLRHRVRRSSK